MKTRKIERIIQNPLHEGFLGRGHLARAVIDGTNFLETDPFILLMDDRLDLPGGEPVGGAHPHAGFETVTLVIKGNEEEWQEGTLEIMTAGKGIVHTEEITTKQEMQILQLWLVLPPDERWATPFHQKIELENVPVYKGEGIEARVYSGTSNGLTSPVKNQTPFTLVDFIMKERAEVVQELPAFYNTFIYMLEGEVRIGDEIIKAGKTAWFDRWDNTNELSEIKFNTFEKNARFVLYAGKPQELPIVQHGPFVGDTRDDIIRLYKEYRDGEMPHLNNIPTTQKIVY